MPMEKIYVFHKPHSGMSYRAIGHDLSVYESATYMKYVSSNRNTLNKACIDELVKIVWPWGHRNFTLHFHWEHSIP